MGSVIQFGLFDWIDDANIEVGELYEKRIKLVEIAEQAGFYGYHLAEHHGTSLSMAPSPSVFFSALAQRTSKIRFSAMAFLLPLYHPIRLIEEICMLDHLSSGRVEVGISRGVSPYEIKCYGVDPSSTQEIFEEALEVLLKGMTEKSLSFSGKHFQFSDVPVSVGPFQTPHPPIWYPTFSESGTNYAAKNGFNFLTLGPPELVAQLSSLYKNTYEKSCPTSDRMSSPPKVGAMRQIFVAESDQEALKYAEPAYRDWYNSITELWHKNKDSSFDDFFSWESCISNESILVGSVETVKNKIQKLIDQSDINYFVGSFAWGSLPFEQSKKSFTFFAKEVAPYIENLANY
ncbi:MAG: LLM class flavin-dependent oxidoreductase [Pseudomonadota bacterium]|nr:LLM class flavin-dependent oxidoreductase [Pseudomonadota bacterium]